MSKLLRANFTRLWKNKIFWLGMLCMLAFGIYAISSVLSGIKDEPQFAATSPDSVLLAGGTIIGIVAAIFSAFFIGTEYSDGTIRNKLIVGHSRFSIYIANFIVCLTAALMMNIVYILFVMIAGTLLIGNFTASVTVIIQITLASLVPVAALTAVYLLLEMLIHNKAVVIAVMILLSFGFVSYTGIIHDRLNTPEYYDAYSWTDDSGKVHDEPRHKNPSYPTGLKRQYYEKFYDILPGGQISQMSTMIMETAKNNGNLSKENYSKVLGFTGYSVMVIIISSGVGILLFRYKDIK